MHDRNGQHSKNSKPRARARRMNRRKSDRIPVQVAYSAVAVTTDEMQGALEGHVYDISEDGLRFEIDEALPVGTRLMLELLVPSAGTIKVSARIVRVFDEVDDPGPRRMGAKITGFGSPQDEARMDGLLDSFHLGHAA